MWSFVKRHQELFYAIIFSLIFSFMLFIFEPITMYAGNMNDFWFDFYIIIKPSSLFFILAFVCLSIFFTIIYLISIKLKNKTFFLIIFLIAIFGFLCAYIHSNFLSNFLPSLDGTTLDWSDFAANLSSIIVCVVIIAALIFCSIKFGLANTAKYSFFTSLAVFLILLVSLFSTFTTTDVLKSKDFTAISTERNLSTVSTNRNYMVFLLDAVDSTHFRKVVDGNSEYQTALKDFSYYPDTLSAYTFTRDSIPFIFSGVWNENQKPFDEYCTETYDNSTFFNALEKAHYNRNFYDIDSTCWHSREALKFNNIDSLGKDAKKSVFLKEELKYLLFKMLPFPLKRFSRINNMDFGRAKADLEDADFDWGDVNFYHNYLTQPVAKTDDKYFQFIHIEGGHTPFNLNENVEKIPEEEGTYEEKLKGSMKIVETYLNRLKSNGAYNNATIVILADHGFWHNGTSRVNPILYIKGVNETHDQMLVSNKQISYADLVEAFTELLKDKKSTEIFTDIPTEGRTRRYLNNSFKGEDHMQEYETTDNAWKAESLKPTGKEFNL